MDDDRQGALLLGVGLVELGAVALLAAGVFRGDTNSVVVGSSAMLMGAGAMAALSGTDG